MNGKECCENWLIIYTYDLQKWENFEQTCQVIILISQSSYRFSCRKCQKKWKKFECKSIISRILTFFLCFSIQVIDCVMNCIVWQTQLHLWKMTNSFCCCVSCLIDQNALGCFSEARQSAQTFKGQTMHRFHKKNIKSLYIYHLK